MTHPHILAAVAALASLRAAYPRLADAMEGEAHGVRTRPRPRHLTARAAARQDDLLRAERAERRAGDTTFGASPAPVRAALIDAQIAAQTVLESLCWDVAELLRAQPPPYVDARRAHVRYTSWGQRAAYLASGVQWVAPEHAERIARQLGRADRLARAALHIGPDHRPLPGGSLCPCCGEPSLRAEVSSEDERDWTITCTARCTCAGTQCSCRRPGREPGLPHVWPVEEYASNFGELRPYLMAARAIEQGAATADGHVWATAEDLRRVLAVDVEPRRWAARLQQWRSRGYVQAVRRGRANWYRLDQAVARLGSAA